MADYSEHGAEVEEYAEDMGTGGIPDMEPA